MVEEKNSWGDKEEEKVMNQYGGRDIENFKLSPGTHTVRLLGKYKFSMEHWNVFETKKKVICPGKEACPICAKLNVPELSEADLIKHTPKPSYYINIIDRKDGKIKIWSFGRGLKKDISEIAEGFGNPENYDLTIKRVGTTKTDTRYSALPTKNASPLTEEEKAMVLTDAYNLEKIYAPMNPAEINELFEKEAAFKEASKE